MINFFKNIEINGEKKSKLVKRNILLACHWTTHEPNPITKNNYLYFSQFK